MILDEASISDAEVRALTGLGVALAIGLLFGLERGWRATLAEASRRSAGVRTFGLIGLLGGTAGLLSEQVEPAILGWMFAALALVFIVAFALNAADNGDTGITSLVGALLAFSLGALSTLHMIATAVASAVVATLLLGFKPQLHAWIERLERSELQATLKLLLLALVILPILPDEGFGPGGAVNPYALWWLVVLIAGISYVGYFAVRIAGPHKGILLTSLLGGLASSTAVTVQLAKLAARGDADRNLLAAGILVANATLAPRILVISGTIDHALAVHLLLPLVAMVLPIGVAALVFWLGRSKNDAPSGVQVENPLALGLALRFGAFLTLVAVLTQLAKDAFGDSGILTLAALSGLLDVNAITLSVARMDGGSGWASIAASAVLVAILSNAVFKTLVCGVNGTLGLALRVGLPLVAAASAALVAVWQAQTGDWLAILRP